MFNLLTSLGLGVLCIVSVFFVEEILSEDLMSGYIAIGVICFIALVAIFLPIIEFTKRRTLDTVLGIIFLPILPVIAVLLCWVIIEFARIFA